MLLSSREGQESVVVGGKNDARHPLTVMALEIGSGDMNLAVDADSDFPANRSEVVWENLCEAAGRTC